MATKIGLEFKGYKELLAKFEKLGGNVEKTVEKMEIESQKHIADKAQKAIATHHRTGKTEKSIVRDGHVEWSGFTASIDVGFDLTHGGLPSVFLMYGTPRRTKGHNRGKVDKDVNLYNSVYGRATKKEVAQLQQDIYESEMKKILGS